MSHPLEPPSAAEGPNLYLHTATVYDLDCAYCDGQSDPLEDVPFYLDLAARLRPRRILEIGCGTGRVSIPLARAGHHVVGIDLSTSMLGELQRKLERLPPPIAARIEARPADMRGFSLDERFDAVWIPFNTFQALLSEDDARACLRCVRDHLAEHGTFVLTLNAAEAAFTPVSLDAALPHTAPRQEWELVDAETGATLVFRRDPRGADWDRGRTYHEDVLIVRARDGSETRFADSFVLQYYSRECMTSLLQSEGFEVTERFGGYDRRPLGSGMEYIFLAKLRGGAAAARDG